MRGRKFGRVEKINHGMNCYVFENMTSFSFSLSLPLSSKGRRNEREREKWRERKMERERKEEGERGNRVRGRERHDMIMTCIQQH